VAGLRDDGRRGPTDRHRPLVALATGNTDTGFLTPATSIQSSTAGLSEARSGVPGRGCQAAPGTHQGCQKQD
jgi:hypothetical protein